MEGIVFFNSVIDIFVKKLFTRNTTEVRRNVRYFEIHFSNDTVLKYPF